MIEENTKEGDNNTNKEIPISAKVSDLVKDGIEYIKELVNLEDDKADPAQSIRDIEKSVVFKGTNVWILMFSILVASLGLNVNSPAVIIGAMLISPLLGPIMGVGLGIGINSFELIKKSLLNLLVMVGISIFTSALYFMITPLKDLQSEILARTQPAIWDVGIAFFGGLAGIVAISRREKSTVIPGVAIATALMPPLCTAGYGLGTLQFNYFIGAFYLFFINSVFICLATVIIVRYLKYPHKQFVDKRKEKRVRRYIAVVVIITILPSIYLAYNIVSKSIFERHARAFIADQFESFENTKVIYPVLEFHPRDSSIIDITLIGEPLEQDVIDFIKVRKKDYKLEKTKLLISQGGSIGTNLEQTLIENINQNIRTGVLEEIYKKREEEMDYLRKSRDSLTSDMRVYEDLNSKVVDVSQEIAIQYPGVKSFSLSRNLRSSPGNNQIDTLTIAMIQIDRQVFKEKQKFESWMKVRTKHDELEFIYY